jgi:hypothetical protein
MSELKEVLCFGCGKRIKKHDADRVRTRKVRRGDTRPNPWWHRGCANKMLAAIAQTGAK